MHTTIACTGCGQSMQVAARQQGRLLSCPACQVRVSIPLPAVPASRRRLSWWLLAAVGGVLLVGTVAGAAALHWSLTRPPEPVVTTAGGFQPLRPSLGGVGAVTLDPVGEPATGIGRPKDAGIDPHDAVEGHLLPGQLPPPAQPLEQVGKLPASLAVGRDPTTGQLILATADGRLLWFDAGTFAARGSCRLDRPAYQLVIDGKRRRLYTAAAATLSVNHLGDRDHSPADLHAYDLDALRADPQKRHEPTHRLDLDAHVTGLLPAADGASLYYVAETPRDVQIGRLGVDGWTREKTLWYRLTGPTWLSRTPDGSRLVVLAGAKVLTIDPVGWEPTDCVGVSSSVQAVAAGNFGWVYLLERRLGTQVQVIDLPRRKQLARWTVDGDSRPALRLSADGGRLYVGTSAVVSGRLWGVDVSKYPVAVPEVVGYAVSDHRRLLRGGLTLVDGTTGPLVVTGSGVVFRSR